MTYLWWEEVAGFAGLVDEGLIERTLDEEGTPHYTLTDAGLQWVIKGEDAEAVRLP